MTEPYRHPPPAAPRPGKRERTRARLIAATAQVLGTVGYENTTVLEITRVADVSNGTFYLHFKDKAEVVEVAVFQVAHRIISAVHEDEGRIRRLPERVAYALRQAFEAMLADPVWLKAMLATHSAVPEFRRLVRVHMMEALHEGITRGAFALKPSDVQIESLSAVLMTGLGMRLEAGESAGYAVDDCIELILRMLGVGKAEAWRLSRKLAKATDTT